MAKILAEGRGLSKTFPARGQGKGAVLHGVSQVDLVVYEGRPWPWWGVRVRKEHPGPAPAGPAAPTQGQVFFDGRDLAACSPRDLRALRRQMQMVFQDTAASLNPRLTVEGILAEPLRVHRLCPRREIPARAAVLLDQVGLPWDLLGRYPHALSGASASGWALPGPWPCPPGWWSAMSRSRPWMCRCRPRCSTCWPTCRRRGG
ncbi:MAG: ATP-binding cassette domain-containing protein [Evtepia gabavorous]